MANTTFMKDKGVTKDQLKQHAAIFVGAPSDFKSLAKNLDKLPKTTEDFLQQGFLQETIAHHAFITKSFWQDKQPLLLIQSIDDSYAQKDFLAHFKGTNENTIVAIETKEGRFVVAAGGSYDSEKIESEQESEVSFVLIVEFVLLVLGIGLVFYFILRKKRKNQILEDKE